MKEESLFNNGFFEFIKTEETFLVNGEEKNIKRNIVRRSPGIRAIIINKKDKKILLSHEFRYELNLFDYRLPGGKVFDTLTDYHQSIKENTVYDFVLKAVFREVKEEVGIEIQNPILYKISHDGASVIWDLFYFIIEDYEVIKNGQMLEENEVVDGFVWKNFDEIIKMCKNGEIHEDRTIGVLLSYIMDVNGD